MHKVKLLRIALVSLALLCASVALAAPTWPPPSGWVPLPGMNDVPNDKGTTGNLHTVPSHLDLVGTGEGDLAGGFYGFDTDYIYFRMRLEDPALSTSWQYGNELFIFIDRPGYWSVGTAEQEYAPDFALRLTPTQINAVYAGSLDLVYLDPSPAQHKWFWLGEPRQESISDFEFRIINGVPSAWADGADPNNPDYVAQPDSFVDLAISWDKLRVASEGGLDYQQSWHINYGTNDPNDDPKPHQMMYSDLGAGEVADPSEQFDGDSYATPMVTTPEPASMALTLVAVGLAGGVARRRKARNEAGREE